MKKKFVQLFLNSFFKFDISVVYNFKTFVPAVFPAPKICDYGRPKPVVLVWPLSPATNLMYT